MCVCLCQNGLSDPVYYELVM